MPKRNKEDFSVLKEEFENRLEFLQRQNELYERDWQSCNDEVVREWWDDLGPESDFDSDDLSHESYPPYAKKMKNPEYLAQLELFRERMKSKFMFNNCYTHINDP